MQELSTRHDLQRNGVTSPDQTVIGEVLTQERRDERDTSCVATIPPIPRLRLGSLQRAEPILLYNCPSLPSLVDLKYSISRRIYIIGLNNVQPGSREI